MAVKYVKDFEFSKDAGFSGSCAPMKKAMGGRVNGQLNKIMDAVRRSPQAQQMMAESMQRPEMAERPMQEAPQQPQQPTMMKKGGSVRGKKIAKVMREYKKGELHSGSKKGPVVKNPKQAMAIALSEARKTKKAKGGEVKKPKKEEGEKKPKMKTEDLALKKMRHAEKYAPGMDLDNIHSYELSQESKKEKKVEKYQAGGLAERRAAREARVTQIRSESDARRAAMKPAKAGSRLEAVRAANAERRAASRAERDAARQARYARQDARMAARLARKNRPAAPEAPPMMAKGGIARATRPTPMGRVIENAVTETPPPSKMQSRLAAIRADQAARRARNQARADRARASRERFQARKTGMNMAKGGEVKKAVHKHEKAMHPGKPLTKLKKGGLPVHQGSPMYGRK